MDIENNVQRPPYGKVDPSLQFLCGSRLAVWSRDKIDPIGIQGGSVEVVWQRRSGEAEITGAAVILDDEIIARSGGDLNDGDGISKLKCRSERLLESEVEKGICKAEGVHGWCQYLTARRGMDEGGGEMDRPSYMD